MIRPLNHEKHQEHKDEVQAPISPNPPPNLDFKGSVGAEMSVEHDEIERNERGGV